MKHCQVSSSLATPQRGCKNNTNYFTGTIDSICAYLKCFRPSTETGADLKSIPIFQMLSDIQLIEMLVDLRDELVRRRTKTTRTTLSTDPDLSDERNKERRFLAELPKSTLFELIGESLTEYERRSKKKTMSMHGVMPRVRPSDPPETYSTPLVYHRKDGPQTQKRERGQSEIFSNTPSNHVKGKSTISGSSPASSKYLYLTPESLSHGVLMLFQHPRER